jgi:FkbM family methyltransferase
MLGLYHRIDIALTARRIYGRGDPELRRLPALVGEGRRALDIGANRGVFSYWLARCCPAVEAFEPNPALARALAAAHFERVRVHALALSDAAGEAELLVPPHRKGGLDTPSARLVSNGSGAGGVRFAVKLARLDDLAFTEVDFIKIDVEGFEEEVLNGGWQTITQWRPVMLVELIERLRPGCLQRVVARLGTAGYFPRFLDQDAWLPLSRLGPGEIGPSGRFIVNFLFVPQEKAAAVGPAPGLEARPP